MKKTLIILLIILFISLFFNCDMTIIPDFWSIDIGIKHNELVSYSIDELWDFTKDNIEYKREKKEHFKTPQETWNDKCGDCEDRAMLFLALCNKYKGIKGKIAHLDDNNGKGHIYAIVNNKPYNKLDVYKYNYREYSFDEIPYYASSKR